jgi:hypothetical protein
MLNKRWIEVVTLLFAALAATAVSAKAPVQPGSWIVELADPPTVEFRGGRPDTAPTFGGLQAEAMQPTAPALTGEHRLNVDSPAVRRYADYLDRARGVVLDRIRGELGRDVRPKFVYRHLKNGFAAEMSAAEAARVAEIDGVRVVRPDYIQRIHTDAGPEWIGAPALWSGSTGAPNPNRGEGTVLGVIDTGVNWSSIFFDTSQSAEPVNNPRGEFFGLCADGTLDVCNDKLIGIYDFTDEGSRGFDPDGHGSHVASTAIGLPLSFSLDFGAQVPFDTSGVAPRASFISYKACQEPEDGGGGFVCPSTATTAALEQALTDGVDAVNYSIGGPPFDPWSPVGGQRLFLNLRAAGVVPAVSAGNDGPGDFTVSSPANTPWVMAVANAHHGRILANRLVGTSGGLNPPGSLVGLGLTEGTGTEEIVYAGDFGNALCGVGEAELGESCSDNTGATSPFAPGTFDGQIVVCDRGVYGRIEKGKNVLDAGAAGMILANTGNSAQSVVADDHCLPATHVDRDSGDELRAWLASGSNHRGRLTGTERFIDEALSGDLRNSSSRGPSVGAPGVMKPNVTAPGTEVLAASTAINSAGDGPGPNAANQIGLLTGTSMASPHVAGASLLLRAAQPGWGVDTIVSALETTADPDIVSNADGSAARVIDRGAGGVRVDQAAQIGLYLPVTEQQFLDANPAEGGDPSSLNLPGLLDPNCVGTCVFTRTVRALGNGSWSVSGEGDLNISVTPASFSLTQGQSQVLQIEVSRADAGVGDWSAGSVVLQPTGGGFATQRLPVGARIASAALPGVQAFQAQSNRGRGQLVIPEIIDLDELVFRTSALVRPEQGDAQLPEDPTNGDPFDDSDGAITELVSVPPGALLLHAETFTSTADDVDLYVGRDENGDGRAQGFELVCSSTTPDDLELCDVETPAAGTWWIVVQNWDGVRVAGDLVRYEFAVLGDDDDPSLVAVGPGAHDGGPLSLPIYWDQSAMEQGDRWFGAVALASEPARTADIGIVPVTVTRTGTNAPAEVALFEGESYTTVIPGGTAHERMFIDVPPQADAVTVTVQGPASDVSVRRRAFSELAASVPATPPAPAEVLAQAARDGDTWSVQIGAVGQSIEAGRYYIVVENDGADELPVEVLADVTLPPSIGTPPPSAVDEAENYPRRGLWGPEARAINQGLDFQLGNGGRFAVWYTYDEQRRPTFYITDTIEFDPAQRFFRAVLFRATSNDVRSNLEVVGEVQITAIAENRFMFAWRLNGNHGSELFNPVSGTSCPTLNGQVTPLLGHWFSPTTAAGGVTLLSTATTEAWIRYYYDRLNQPRWVLADTPLQGSGAPGAPLTMEVLGFRGFCIYCDPAPISTEVIGTLEREFIDADTVREASDFVARPGVDASVDIDRQIELLSLPAVCTD